MFFDKQAVLDHISEQVGPDQAAQAAQMLPDQVDHEQHASLLQQFGIDPQNMVSQLAQQFGGSGEQGQRGYGEQGQRGYGDQGLGGYGEEGQGGYGDEEEARGYEDTDQGA
jgi:hypothetical protein